MCRGSQVDRHEDQCTGNRLVEPLVCRCSHTRNREINDALSKVVRRHGRIESRVIRELVLGFSVFVVGSGWFQGGKIGMAVMLDPRGEHEDSESDKSPDGGCLN